MVKAVKDSLVFFVASQAFLAKTVSPTTKNQRVGVLDIYISADEMQKKEISVNYSHTHIYIYIYFFNM